MTCVAFSIKFAKTNQKFAENSEFCEKKSLLFKIIHFTPYSKQPLGVPPSSASRRTAKPGPRGPARGGAGSRVSAACPGQGLGSRDANEYFFRNFSKFQD